MRIDSPILENITILTGSFEVTGTVIPGDSSTYDLGTPVKSWKTVYSTALSGSLTKLSSGGDYLVAGSNITLSTGSSGAITISAAGTSGGSIIAGSNTQVQFNDGGNFGANSGLTYNKTTQALTGTYVVASTGFTGSLTKLSDGTSYLVGGNGVTVTTGSNGSVTISFGSVNYATASFTNATSVTVNHSVGLTLYDIEVFDTSYNKIVPGSATATSTTQANLTFAIPTSGYVAVGGPTAGSISPIITVTTGSAPYYGARAWVNFNGTGTVAIRASSNVSSITDNAVGSYTINFSTTMPDANYTILTTAAHPAGSPTAGMIAPVNTAAGVPSTSAFSVYSLDGNNTTTDGLYMFAAVFR